MVQADDLPVRRGAQQLLRPEAADPRVLHAERARAPEPVGVPAPQVVADGEAVALHGAGGTAVLDGAVVDRLLVGHTRVVRDGPGLVGPPPQTEVGLVGREDDPVEEIDLLVVVRPRLTDPRQRRLERGEGVEPHVPQFHEPADRFEGDAQPHRVPEGAVGVGEAAEERAFALGAVGAGGDDLAGAGEDVHLEHGLVRQAQAERGGLDAQAGHGAAEGDGLELRHDVGHQAVRQGGVDEVLVGAHPLDVGGAGVGIHGDDAREAGGVETGRRRQGARSEEVGCLLGQPDGLVGGHGPEAVDESLHAARVAFGTDDEWFGETHGGSHESHLSSARWPPPTIGWRGRTAPARPQASTRAGLRRIRAARGSRPRLPETHLVHVSIVTPLTGDRAIRATRPRAGP